VEYEGEKMITQEIILSLKKEKRFISKNKKAAEIAIKNIHLQYSLQFVEQIDSWLSKENVLTLKGALGFG